LGRIVLGKTIGGPGAQPRSVGFWHGGCINSFSRLLPPEAGPVYIRLLAAPREPIPQGIRPIKSFLTELCPALPQIRVPARKRSVVTVHQLLKCVLSIHLVFFCLFPLPKSAGEPIFRRGQVRRRVEASPAQLESPVAQEVFLVRLEQAAVPRCVQRLET